MHTIHDESTTCNQSPHRTSLARCAHSSFLAALRFCYFSLGAGKLPDRTFTAALKAILYINPASPWGNPLDSHLAMSANQISHEFDSIEDTIQAFSE